MAKLFIIEKLNFIKYIMINNYIHPLNFKTKRTCYKKNIRKIKQTYRTSFTKQVLNLI